jgi:hypothetical protein
MDPSSDSPTFMFIFRSPVDFPDPAPEQMQRSFQRWMAWIQDLRAKGHYLAGDPLDDRPGKVLRDRTHITDGPFVEAKECVGGYMLIKAPDFAAAVELAKGCPFDTGGGQIVEVRQLTPTAVRDNLRASGRREPQ